MDYQKINHFPLSTEITRKDRLAENMAKMQAKYPKEDLAVTPETYVLPDQMQDFKDAFINHNN